MTQQPAPSPAARAPRRPAVSRPALRVVRPQPRSISHLPFVLLCAGVLAAGLIVVLLLNTALAKGSYEAHALEDRSAQLDEQQQQLSTLLAARQGPQGLAAAALELGMVRPDSVRWLDLTTGTVSGSAAPARAGDQPSIVTDPSYQRSAPATPSATPTPTPSAATTPSASPSSAAAAALRPTGTARATPGTRTATSRPSGSANATGR